MKKPGAGFVILLLTYGVLVWLGWWGTRQPVLDAQWQPLPAFKPALQVNLP